jgi:hypothetical protein
LMRDIVRNLVYSLLDSMNLIQIHYHTRDVLLPSFLLRFSPSFNFSICEHKMCMFMSIPGTQSFLSTFPSRCYSVIPKTGWFVQSTGWGSGNSLEDMYSRNYHQLHNMDDLKLAVYLKNCIMVGVNYVQVDADEILRKEIESFDSSKESNEGTCMKDALLIGNIAKRESMVIATKIHRPSESYTWRGTVLAPGEHFFPTSVEVKKEEEEVGSGLSDGQHPMGSKKKQKMTKHPLAWMRE